MRLRAFLSLLSDSLRALPVATLYITERCSSRCVCCDYWRSGRNEISMDLVKKLACELHAFGTRYILLSGGEPLQHPQWAAIGAVFKELGLQVGLATNGLLLAKNADALEACIDQIYLSLDGATPESYRAIRGVDGLECVMRGMDRISGKIPVTVRTAVQRRNYAEIPSLIRLARSLGASHHSFLAVDTRSRAAFARGEEFECAESLCVEDLGPFARVLENVEREFDDEFASGYIRESKSKLRLLHGYFAARAGLRDFPPVRCNAPRFSAVIETDGSIKPCFFLPSSGRFDGTPMSRALNTAIGKDLRRQQRLGLRQECSRCVCPAYRRIVELLEGM